MQREREQKEESKDVKVGAYNGGCEDIKTLHH
jgi:hypothetical protein